MATSNKSKTGSGAKKNAPEKAGTVAEQVKPIEETKKQPEAQSKEQQERTEAQNKYFEVFGTRPHENVETADILQAIEDNKEFQKNEAKKANEDEEARYANVYKELHEVTGEYPDPQLNVEQLEELLEAKKQEQIDREAQDKESKLQEDLAKQAELEAKASQKAQEKKAIQQDDPNVIWVQDANKNKKKMNRVTWDIVKKSQTEWKEVPKAPIEVQKLK